MSGTTVASRNASSGTEGIEDRWIAYRATGSSHDRDRLVLHYLGLTTYVASRVGFDLPSSVDYADLIQAGVVGLMDAVARFDPDRGLKFETFAVHRIRGAMLDELRSLDWVPRSVRRKARDLDSAYDECYRRLNHVPSALELCESLEISVDELHRMRSHVGRSRIASLDASLAMAAGAEGLSLAETLCDPDSERPGDALETQLLHGALAASLAALGDRERAVLVHSYVDGLTLAQIGQILGVTESRVCQLRSVALKKVREDLAVRLAH